MKKLNLMLVAILATLAGASLQAADVTGTMQKGIDQPECSMLSSDEQAFAAKLTDANRKAFCAKFTSAQRSAAMMSVNATMTPDQAVQKVITDNNISMVETAECSDETCSGDHKA